MVKGLAEGAWEYLAWVVSRGGRLLESDVHLVGRAVATATIDAAAACRLAKSLPGLSQ